MKDISISKLQISKNHRKSDVSKNSKVVSDFLQNRLYEGKCLNGSFQQIFNDTEKHFDTALHTTPERALA